MTHCSESLERLPLYVGGELEAMDAALVAGHLAQCEACSREEKKLQGARDLFRGTVSAPAVELTDLNLWSGIRASMLSEGLLGDAEPESNNWELRPVPSAAPRLSLVRRVASFASAAAVIGLASLAGSGLLSPSAGPEMGPDVASFEPGQHSAPVASALELQQGESAMRSVAPGEASLSLYSRTLRPSYQPSPVHSSFPVDPRGISLAGYPGASSMGVDLGIELR